LVKYRDFTIYAWYVSTEFVHYRYKGDGMYI